MPEAWVATLREAAGAGLDIGAGLHVRLASLPGLAQAAERGRARLIDVRVPPPGLPVGTGRKRTGRRLLTVGTDCACGKKYTALALDAEMRRRGRKSDFRATGQTGIMIAGRGLPIDAVVSDFVTGAAEVLSPDNNPDHWDMIEGQGGLFHPGYLQVTVGLLVGSQPDAFVVCHDPLRRHISGWPDFPLPSIAQLIERTLVAVQAEIGFLKETQLHRLVREVLDEILVRPIESLAADLVLWFRRMFGSVDLLDQMALRAGDAIQRRIAGPYLIYKYLGMIGKLPDLRCMAAETERLVFSIRRVEIGVEGHPERR